MERARVSILLVLPLPAFLDEAANFHRSLWKKYDAKPRL